MCPSLTHSHAYISLSRSNHTAGEADQYQKGNVACFRDADAPWWRHDVSHWWLFLLVPCFSLSLSLWNAQPFKSKQLPVMVFISCVSFVANMAGQSPSPFVPSA